MFEIEKIVHKGAYDYCIVRGHPNSTSKDYVLHHRVVMENSLGRVLTKDEVVHHIDENKKNNVIENLGLMTKAEHSRHHSSVGRNLVNLTCPNCGLYFTKEKRMLWGKVNPKCSRKCNGEYSRKIQLGKVTNAPIVKRTRDEHEI